MKRWQANSTHNSESDLCLFIFYNINLNSSKWLEFNSRYYIGHVFINHILDKFQYGPTLSTWHTCVYYSLDHWCRRWGCREWKHIPKSCDSMKIRAKFLKIREKFLKTFTNSAKIWANTAPNILWFDKNGDQTLFGVFLGRFGENSGKNPSHPQKFAYFYTYGLDT